MRHPSRTLRALAVLAGCAALVSSPLAASAQTQVRKEPSAGELQLAKEMLKDAAAEVKAGKCADALSILKQIVAIKESGEVYLHMGDCQAKEGKLLEALASYERGEDLARRDKDKATQQALVGKVADLRARIPTVSLQLPEGVSEPKVKIDGEEVASDRLDKPIPLMPGEHTVEVTASGRKTFNKTLTLAEKDTTVVPVELAEEGGGAAATGGGGGPTPEEKPDKKESPPVPLATWIGGGAAIVLLAGGILAFVAAGSEEEDGRKQCAEAETCDESAKDTVRQLDAAALGMWIGAGVAAGVAVTFFVLSRSDGDAKASVGTKALAPRRGRLVEEARIVVTPGSLRVVGSF